MDEKDITQTAENGESTEKKTPRYIRGKYCEGQRESTNKFLRENYFNIRFRKIDHDIIVEAAATAGMSMSAFVNDAVFRRVYEVLDEKYKKEEEEKAKEETK